MIQKWETINKRKVDDFKIFDLLWITRKNESIGKESEFVVLNSPQWVNIIPITKNNEIVLIQQYRQGIDDLTIEVPGGLVEKNEEPILAAQRECTEETGFISSKKAELLGVNTPNPAFLNNKCYSYIWFDCEQKFPQQLDKNEDIKVILKPIDKVKSMILNGNINHSLVLTAFFFYFLKSSDF